MKKSLIPVVLLALLAQQKTNAQDYIPMDTITDWQIHVGYFGGSAYYWYSYVGDTVFHGQTYRIIQNLGNENFTVYHYFREDHATQRVYKFIPADDEEVIYYDFGLEVGDDFYVAESGALFTVYNIDTVDSEVGPLRRWYLERNSLYFTYTEGIGGDVPDYQYWIYVQDPTHAVVCAYHSCDKIYGNGDCEPNPTRIDTTSFSDSFCEGDIYLLPDGSPTNVPGIYQFVFSSAEGCDSTVIVDLNQLPIDVVIIDSTICEGDIFEGGGPYAFINQYGCDSIVTFSVTVEPLHYAAETYQICTGDSVYGISLPGIYTITLPSEITCDTLLTLIITQLPEGDPACITSTIDHDLENVRIFPNPVSNELHVETSDPSIHVEILDLSGVRVGEKNQMNAGINSIHVDRLFPGMYLLNICSASGSFYYKVIKQ